MLIQGRNEVFIHRRIELCLFREKRIMLIQGINEECLFTEEMNNVIQERKNSVYSRNKLIVFIQVTNE